MKKSIDFNNKELILLALQETNDGIWAWHIPSGTAYFTPRYYTMLGYEPGEMEASYQTWLELLHPEDSPKVHQQLDYHIENKDEGYEIEFRMRHKNGEWLWILGRGKVLEWDTEGRPVVLAGTHIDIDDKKKLHAKKEREQHLLENTVEERTRELKETLALLEATFDAIPDILGVQDHQHKMIRYNEAGYRALGKSPQEIKGKTCFELVGRKTQCPHCATAETYRTKKPASVVHYVQHMDAWLDVRSYPILDENGNITKVIEHLRNITKEKKAEQERQELLEQLHHAKKMESLGNLAGGVAHDFNNFLMAIQGRLSLMLLSEDNQESNLEHIDAITGYIDSAKELTAKLIGTARGGKYEVKPMDLNSFLQEHIKLFGRTHKNIVINVQLPEFPLIVLADKTQLEQVMLNLCINAAHAMKSVGTLTLKAQLYLPGDEDVIITLPHGNYCQISLTDTGHGMDDSTMQKIFDPFFTTKDKDHGSGLGLASAYGIIKNHGGALTVTSRVGEGSTFHIYLPLSDEKVPETKTTNENILFGQETILLVDDEQMINEVHKRVLNKLGYQVVVALNREEALNSLVEHFNDINLILLDMIMPGVDIVETFDSIKRIKPDIKILLCSGYAVDDNAQTLIDKGANGFLQKPFSLNVLSQRIRQILDG